MKVSKHEVEKNCTLRDVDVADADQELPPARLMIMNNQDTTHLEGLATSQSQMQTTVPRRGGQDSPRRYERF